MSVSSSQSPSGSSRKIPFADDPLPLEPGTVVTPEGRSAPDPLDASELLTDSLLTTRLFPHLYDASDLREEDRSPAGVRLGHFELMESIGFGGMAAVFRAVDTRLDREVALKVLAPSVSRDPKSVRRFQNEARTGAQFDHENIARVYHYGADAGFSFIAYELVPGDNLRDLIKREGRLSIRDAVNVGLQVASALRHLVARGVVHRDIKPSNILLAPNQRIKLIDLGLARDRSLDLSTDLTIAGTTLGTFDYISPEQAKDPTQVTVASDIYSLGCTLYHMLTGRPPYPEGTVLQKLLDHQANSPPDPRKDNPHVSARFASVIRKMMASDPKRRQGSPEELIHDLAEVANELGLRRMPVDSAVWTQSPGPQSRFLRENLGWFATASLLVLLVLFLNRYGDDVQSRVFPETVAFPSEDRTQTDDLPTPSTKPLPTPTPLLSETDPNRSSSSERTPNGEETDPGLQPLVTTDTPSPEPGPFRGYPFDIRPILDPELFPTVTPSEQSTFDPDSEQTSDSEGSSPSTVPPTPTGSPTDDDRAPFLLRLASGDTRGYTSLEAACAEAGGGDVIELDYDGVRLDDEGQPISEKPIVLSRKAIRISGAEGRRPTVRFAPTRRPGQSPESHLVQILGGSLTLTDLDLQIEVDSEAIGADWSVFAAEGVRDIEFERVTCTVRNPLFKRVALIDFFPGRQRLEEMPSPEEGLPINGGVLRIRNSFLRGVTNLIGVRQDQSLTVNVTDSAIAIDGTFLSIDGEMPTAREAGQIDLSITRCTALLGQGLLQFSAGQNPVRSLPSVSATLRENVLASLNPDAPLILMTGALSSQNFLELLPRWIGEFNRYDRFREFLTIASELEATPQQYDFEAWATRYEPEADRGGISWMSNWQAIPVEEMTRSALTVEPGSDDTDAEPEPIGPDLNKIPPVQP